jgi:hypothetical protein
VKKALSRFKDTAFSGCFRGDGKLVVAGTEDNNVKVDMECFLYFKIYHDDIFSL